MDQVGLMLVSLSSRFGSLPQPITKQLLSFVKVAVHVGTLGSGK